MEIIKSENRALKIYKLFLFQYIKSLMQSKVNFAVGLVGFLLSQCAGIIFLYLVFEQIPLLSGWSYNEMLFVYGFSQLPRGLDHMFTDYLWDLSWQLVKRGELDRYLLRPVCTLFQLICQRFQPDALGEILVGFILIIYSINNGILHIYFFNIFIFVISIIAGGIIFSSIKLIFSSLAFWMKDSFSLLKLVYDFSQFSKYPVSIYSKSIRIIISYIIPFAFTSFYPASYFLNKSDGDIIIIEIIIAICISIFSYMIFNEGLNRYESAGN